LCKVKEAIPAWDEHVLAFKEFSAALPVESMKEWATCIEALEQDSKKPNPFYTELASQSFILIPYCHLLSGTQLSLSIKYSFS
jgi:hypothetical protein